MKWITSISYWIINGQYTFVHWIEIVIGLNVMMFLLYLQKQLTLIRSGFRNNDLAWPIHSLDQNSSNRLSGSYQKKIEWNWWTIEFEFSSNKLTSRVDPKVFCNQTIYLNVKCFSYVLIGLRVYVWSRVSVCICLR